MKRSFDQVDVLSNPIVPTWAPLGQRILLTKTENFFPQLYVFAGGDHSIVVEKNTHGDRVYAAGLNTQGQLGQGHEDSIFGSKEIEFFRGKIVIHAGVGSGHTVIVTRSAQGKDQIYVFGQNDLAQLGFDGGRPLYVPTELTSDCFKNKSITHLAVGEAYALVVTKDNFGKQQIYGFGNNDCSQISNENVLFTCPVEIFSDNFQGKDIFHVSAGHDHALIMSKNHLGFVCIDVLGKNYQKCFGLNAQGDLHTGALSHNEGNTQNQKTVYGFAGGHHTINIVKTQQGCRLYGFGENSDGQLGLGHDDDAFGSGISSSEIYTLRNRDITHVALGVNFSIIVAKAVLEGPGLCVGHQVYVCGANEKGQLGLGYTEENVIYPLVKK